MRSGARSHWRRRSDQYRRGSVASSARGGSGADCCEKNCSARASGTPKRAAATVARWMNSRRGNMSGLRVSGRQRPAVHAGRILPRRRGGTEKKPTGQPLIDRKLRNVEIGPAASVMAGASFAAIAAFFGGLFVFVDFLLADDLPAFVEGFFGEERIGEIRIVIALVEESLIDLDFVSFAGDLE